MMQGQAENATGWSVPDHIVWVADEDSVRLFNAETGDFRRLNETGSQIWRLMFEEALSQDRICEQLADVYGAQTREQQDQVSTDVYAFTDELVEQGIISADSL